MDQFLLTPGEQDGQEQRRHRPRVPGRASSGAPRRRGAVRKVILRHLPHGCRESMNWGMISYEIPLERYPKTYNGQPLGYAAVTAQKNHFAVYLMCAYHTKLAAWLKAEFKKAGRKLDMGKSCVRFRKLEDLPLEVIGEAVAKLTPEEHIAYCEASWKK
jgi:hypothetical protein